MRVASRSPPGRQEEGAKGHVREGEKRWARSYASRYDFLSGAPIKRAHGNWNTARI